MSSQFICSSTPHKKIIHFHRCLYILDGPPPSLPSIPTTTCSPTYLRMQVDRGPPPGNQRIICHASQWKTTRFARFILDKSIEIPDVSRLRKWPCQYYLVLCHVRAWTEIWLRSFHQHKRKKWRGYMYDRQVNSKATKLQYETCHECLILN